MICIENTGYRKPNFRQGEKMAEEFGLTRQYAMNARRRYLVDDLELLDLEIAFYDDYEGSDIDNHFSFLQYSELTLKRATVKHELRGIKNVNIRKPGLTDEMIDRAREYPVGQLIEFKHGKTIAFCHEDKNPSMYHATRINKANCPVCGKSFDSIGILMERDGMSFKEAVTNLSR